MLAGASVRSSYLLYALSRGGDADDSYIAALYLTYTRTENRHIIRVLLTPPADGATVTERRLIDRTQ